MNLGQIEIKSPNIFVNLVSETTYDYFYGTQTGQFTFYRLHKVLITDPRFKKASSDAKIQYGVMLERMALSMKNQWIDE